MNKLIIIFFCFTSTLHPMELPSGIVISRVQESQMPALISFNKKIIEDFFKPLMLTKHPENPFPKNKFLLDTFLNKLDSGFETHLKDAVTYVEYKNDDVIIHMNNNAHVMVASHKDLSNILGFCAFTKMGDCIYINLLAVSHNFRRKGIGKALLKSALLIYKDTLCCKLQTFAYANESVQLFYKRFGFNEIGFNTIIKDGPTTHIMYELKINK